jgi:hypothetical protein
MGSACVVVLQIFFDEKRATFRAVTAMNDMRLPVEQNIYRVHRQGLFSWFQVFALFQEVVYFFLVLYLDL